MIKIHPNLINFVRPSEHSTFSPSSTDRWMACPFSIKASEGIPNKESIYSKEGTLAHSVCEALFNEEYFMLPFQPDLQMELTLWEAQNPGAIAEMMDCARTYVDVVSYWLNNKLEIGEVLWYGLEKGIPIFPEEGCFGTGDCIIVGTNGCAVIDYKHGKGKNVSADSPQLKSYASGVARHLENVPENYGYYSVVVQPRTDIAPKVARYSHEETLEHLQLVHEAIMMTKQPSLYPVEGNHCFWCPARKPDDSKKKCPAIAGKAVQLANEDFGKFLSDMNAPVPDLKSENKKRDEALIKIISLLPLMQQIAKDGTDEFTLRIEGGETIPGLLMSSKQGNRAWIHGDMEIMGAEIKKTFPEVNPFKVVPETKKLLTLSEVEKIVGKDKATILTVRPMSKKLTIQDNKIQEVLGEMAAFGNLITGDFSSNE